MQARCLADAESLDAEVRRVDEDRWLASRFAPRDVRARLIALYALYHEIARTAEVVSDAGVGAIRLAWWRESVEEIVAGQPPRRHAVLAAFSEAFGAAPPAGHTLREMIDARAADFEATPFQSLEDLEAYVDATAGGVMRLAVEACGEAVDERASQFVGFAGRAWGLTGLLRSASLRRARRQGSLDVAGLTDRDLAGRAQRAFIAARSCARAVSSKAFPAVGYVAAAPMYVRAIEEGRGPPALLLRQLKLVGAAATGRL